MKSKWFGILIGISIVLTVTLFCLQVNAAESVHLVIAGETVECDVPPMIIHNRTMVPVRALFEKLKATVSWNEQLQQVVITGNNTVMVLNLNNTNAFVNGQSVTLDCAPIIMNNRTLVPVRFISENLGYTVAWDEVQKTVSVSQKETQEQPVPIPDAPTVNDKVQLQSVQTSSDSISEVVTVHTTAKVEPIVSRLSVPDRIVLDFYGVQQLCEDGKTSMDGLPVSQVRWASHDSFTRVVLDTNGEQNYTLSYTATGACLITLAKTVNSVQTPVIGEIGGTVSAVTGGLSGKKVVIDAGHGGYDSGAVGKDSNGTSILYEKEVNLDLALRVQKLLQKQGVNVVMTRTTDVALGETEQLDLTQRANIANQSNADLFVSIHNNAFTDPTATGTCVLYADLESHGSYAVTGKELAENILTPLLKATGLSSRGVVNRPNLAVLRKTVMPAVLIECGFVTCETDQKVLLSSTKRDEIAAAIVQGIVITLQKNDKILS